MDGIRTWLERHGLGQYAEAFEANDVDLDVLPALSEADLEALGLSLGHRKRLLRALATVPGVDPPGTASGPVIERVTAGGERRQVTVLFCDLVGSVSLSTRLDPEELRRVIAGYHAAAIRAIQRFEGYAAQILGDGVLAYFGYPLAHEGEAERAVRAALAVVEEVPALPPVAGERLEVRLGIASGLVVVSHILAQDRTAVGETPNLAHRLQSSARPGEIIVSERTRELAGRAFEYEDLGLHVLKGIDGDTRLWRVLGPSDVANRFDAARRGALAPMVGRDDEMALLLDRWERARAGSGQVALLVGEPGIGKSRTMRALRERLGARASLTLEYQCSTFHTNSALYPIIDHLERALRFERGELPEARLDKLERAVTGEWGGGRLECQLLARLLSLPADARFGVLEMTPQRQKEETLQALAGIVAQLAAAAPTLVIFEDAHWADPTTVEMLDLMVARAADLPLLVLVSFRPEFAPDWARHVHVTRLALEHLPRGHAARLIDEVSGGLNLPAELVSQIVDKTDGIPLFVEELTKTVLESGMVVERDGRYVFERGVDRMAVPATLRDSLMARLDRLIPVKEIAQIGAVLGREFPWALVAAVSPMKERELTDALDSLVASGLVFQRGTPPEAIYTFKHALVQDAAYDSLLKAKRQELHAAIAGAMRERLPETLAEEPEVLAQHYTLAGMEAEAVPLWRRAGEQALSRISLNEAISHLEIALRLNHTLPSDPARELRELELRVLLGTAWMALRGWPAQQVQDCFAPALALARRLGRVDALMPISFGLWANMLVRGRIADSVALAQDAIDEAQAVGRDDLAIVGHSAAMISRFSLGDLAEAARHGDEIVARYDARAHAHIVTQCNLDPMSAYGLYAAHFVWMLGFPDRALDILLEKERHARRIGHPFDLGFALTVGSHVLEYRGEPEALMLRVEEAERLGRDASIPFVSEVMAQVMRGVAMLRAGDARSAIDQLRHGITMWNSHGSNIRNPYLKALVAEATAATGDHEQALLILEESLEQVARPGWEERAHLAEILRLKGCSLHALGREADAAAALRASLDCARQQGARSWELRTATTIAGHLADEGRAAAARALLQPVFDGFTEGFGTMDLRAARSLLERVSATG
jgi:class 3 adenylate cyclase/tetratricopeptide (TPR) repeat protein